MSVFNVYSLSPMVGATKESATSEASNHELKFALDFNLDSYWEPTSNSDQDIIIDLEDCDQLVSDVADREFSGTPNWQNSTYFVYDETGDLTIGASAIGQLCLFPMYANTASEGMYAGERYELTYDWDETSAGVKWFLSYANENVASLSDGTGQTQIVAPTAYCPNLEIISTTSIAQGNLDNFYLRYAPERKGVGAYGLWIRDIVDDLTHNGDSTLTVSHSDDGANWTQYDQQTMRTLFKTYRQGQLIIVDGPSTVYRRYWKFAFTSMYTGVTIKVGQFFLLGRHEIAQGCSYPRSTQYGYGSDPGQAVRGRVASLLGFDAPIYRLSRTLNIVNGDHLSALLAAYEYSYGNGLPAIVDDAGVWRVVRFSDNYLQVTEIDHEIYAVTFNMESVPGRQSSEVF